MTRCMPLHRRWMDAVTINSKCCGIGNPGSAEDLSMKLNSYEAAFQIMFWWKQLHAMMHHTGHMIHHDVSANARQGIDIFDRTIDTAVSVTDNTAQGGKLEKSTLCRFRSERSEAETLPRLPASSKQHYASMPHRQTLMNCQTLHANEKCMGKKTRGFASQRSTLSLKARLP